MNVIGSSCTEPCSIPGMSCMLSSGFEVGVGLALCWCAGCASCAKAEAGKRMKEIANTDRNERFMSILTAVLESCVINRRANARRWADEKSKAQIRRASTWWGGEKEARKSAE